MLARIDDRNRPGYPGLLLALIPGEFPLLSRRVNYFESNRFVGYFGPHPDHPPPPTLDELRAARPRLVSEQPAPTPRWWEKLWESIGPYGRAATAAGLAVALSYGGWLLLHQSDTSTIASVPRPASTAPAAPSPASTAYNQGVADWRALQAWFATQSGDNRAGADWWAAHRGDHGVVSCEVAARKYNSRAIFQAYFEDGCKHAKSLLDHIDSKRAEAQYRAGFNDAAKSDSQAPSAQTPAIPARLATVKTPDDLNVREGPGAQYNIVYVMHSGDRVRIVRDLDNGWKEIEFTASDGRTYHGFSSARYLVPDQ